MNTYPDIYTYMCLDACVCVHMHTSVHKLHRLMPFIYLASPAGDVCLRLPTCYMHTFQFMVICSCICMHSSMHITRESTYRHSSIRHPNDMQVLWNSPPFALQRGNGRIFPSLLKSFSRYSWCTSCRNVIAHWYMETIAEHMESRKQGCSSSLLPVFVWLLYSSPSPLIFCPFH